MLLAIDIGNSNIKIGVWQQDPWLAVWRVRTVSAASPAECATLLWACAANDQIALHDITAAVMSSVVPALTPILIEVVHEVCGIEPYLVTPHSQTGLKVALDYPDQVGTDRLVNAVAGFDYIKGKASSAVIVVDTGTATKFDVVTVDNAGGVYRGGAIAPGVAVSGDALTSRIARLPRVELNTQPSIIGTNTADAIQSGLVWGMVALVEGMLARIAAALAPSTVQVIVTGGLSPLLEPHLRGIDAFVPTLTLDGLRLIYRLNQAETA